MTGPASLTGRQYYNGLQLAEKKINEAGGIQGQKVKFVFQDAQSNNAPALNAFIKTIQEVKPSFVFATSYSTQNAAIVPEVLKAKVPVMYAGSADALENLANPYMLRIRAKDSIAAAAMSNFAREHLNIKKPGIIYIHNDFGQGAATAVSKRFEEAGIEVAGVESYAQTDKDMSAQIIRLRNKGADAILAFVFPQDGALLLKQIKSLGYDKPVVASTAAFVPAALQLLNPADLKNVWGVVDNYLPATEQGRTFAEEYKKEFRTEADAFSALYYDGAMIMAKAMNEAGTDPEKVIDYLSKMDTYQGVGSAYRFDEKGNGVHEVAVINFKEGTKDMQFVATVKAGD